MTEPKIIVSAARKPFMPRVDMEGWYVFVSRVRRFADFRVLELPSRHTCFYKRCACPYKGVAPLDNLLELRHDAELRVWNEGYDANGDWSVELARQTAGQVVAERAAAKPNVAAKPTATSATTGCGKRKAAFDASASEAKRRKTVPVQATATSAGATSTATAGQLDDQFLQDQEDEFGGAAQR